MFCLLYKFIVSALLCLLLMSRAAYALGELESVSVDYTDHDSGRCVVVLHGLARTASSMSAIKDALHKEGYSVALVDYPSRYHPIEDLSYLAVDAGIQSCRKEGNSRIYFVTHSLGGILVRNYLDGRDIPELERIVMLAPPNHGSSVVDSVKVVPGVVWFNGPAFLELGTDAQSVPLALGEISVDTAVIAGTRSLNPILSSFLEHPNDGKVSVESARLEGMCAMLSIAVSHPFIMENEQVIKQTLLYLATGRFSLPSAEYLDCEARETE